MRRETDLQNRQAQRKCDECKFNAIEEMRDVSQLFKRRHCSRICTTIT